MISANVSSNPISVSVSSPGAPVVARVSSVAVQATASGGSGPAGPPGAPGLSSLTDAVDVELSGLSDGDVLRYEQSRWRNYREENLVDGGNW